MKPHVLDAHALVAYLEREAGFETVAELFTQAVERDTPLLMTSVNMGEVLYMARRECGVEQMELVERTVAELPIDIVTVDMPLARRAAELKATRRMSYPDCFAAALAAQSGGPVVTGDPEFRSVDKDIKVVWLDRDGPSAGA
jgi:predicted nucleic acid-binding protein